MPAQSNQPSSDRPQRRSRGGKRAQRAKRAAQANPTETVTLRPDFNLIADTGDVDAYRDAYERFPDDRDTLIMLFADLHEQVFGAPMITKSFMYDGRAGEETIDSFQQFADWHIQDEQVAIDTAHTLLVFGESSNIDDHEGVREEYKLTNRAKLLFQLRAMLTDDPDAFDGAMADDDVAELVAMCQAAGPVGAEIHSDDGRLEADFDAEPFLRTATEEQIEALAGCGWGADYAADDVAQHLRAADPAVEQVLAYCEAASVAGDPMGYEVSVDGGQALRYLRSARPDIAELVEHCEPVCSGCGNAPELVDGLWRGHDEDCDRLGHEPDSTRGELDS